MNDSDRAACYSAEEDFVALGIPADVEDRIERGWTSGDPVQRRAAADLLLTHAKGAGGIAARQDARVLLRRLYRC